MNSLFIFYFNSYHYQTVLMILELTKSKLKLNKFENCFIERWFAVCQKGLNKYANLVQNGRKIKGINRC